MKDLRELLQDAGTASEAMGPEEALALLDDDTVVFVDVREGHERAKGYIPGSIHAPRGFLEFIADPQGPMHNPVFTASKRLLLYCGSGARSALAAKSCRIVYDLWDEVFRIELAQPGGQLNTVAVNVEGVLRNCAEARRLPLVDRALLTDGTRYFVATLVEVNPVSPEMLDRIKKWVTRPTSSIGPGDSLFGSFVGLFVARIGDADRKLSFRTPAFTRPNPPDPSP